MKFIVSVTNDLSTDQRVHKVCSVLGEMGHEVLLIGRKRKDSLGVNRPYKTKRIRLIFNKGALFYAFYNIRLFFILLFRKGDVFYSNDLDTLLANFLASRIRGKKLIYDSHEYFTEVPELAGRKFARGTWLRIEKWIFPRLKHVITVNKSIADIYHDKYGNKVNVVRNVPEKKPLLITKTREELDLPADKKILVIQGAGINVDRGTEELVEAMKFLDGYLLLIIGSGDVLAQLKQTVSEYGMNEKVRFIGKQPYDEMMAYTQVCDMGVTLDKDTNLNYRYSLPNKLFDYIRAGIPVLSSDLVELRRIIEKYHIGVITPSHAPKNIAATIKDFFVDKTTVEQCRKNTAKAIDALCWENEKEKLRTVINAAINGSSG